MYTYIFENRLYKWLFKIAQAVLKFANKDEVLPELCLTEDISANVEWLMDNFGNQVLRYAYSYMKNMEDAEDILQETMIQYMRKAPTFESSGHAKAWLLTVAGNTAKNKIKYNSYRNHDELNEELTGLHEEDLSFIWEAVKELPVDYREVIHLFYEEDYTTAQIAEVLGRKESTVRSQLKRGRDQLKKILKEVYDFGE